MFGQIDFTEMLIRTTGAFFALLILTRLLGKEQMSQLTFFNYITGITIGSIAADIAGQTETQFFNGLISLIWWSVLTFSVSYIGMKFAKIRSITDGRPTVIIKEGQILEKELGKVRLNMDELSMLLRRQKVFDVGKVNYAFFESDGTLSVQLKPEYTPATKQDQQKIIVKPLYFPTTLVDDGIIQEKQLAGVGITKQWLLQRLADLKLTLDDIFFVQLQSDGTLYIDKRDDEL